MLDIINIIAMVIGYLTVLLSILFWYFIIYVPSNFIHHSRMRKFAWLPTRVDTWRPNRSKAIIWLQHYIVITGESDYFNLNDEHDPIGTKYVNKLGWLSYEY